MKRLFESPLFWILLILGLLSALVLLVERPAPYTPLKQYEIFRVHTPPRLPDPPFRGGTPV